MADILSKGKREYITSYDEIQLWIWKVIAYHCYWYWRCC